MKYISAGLAWLSFMVVTLIPVVKPEASGAFFLTGVAYIILLAAWVIMALAYTTLERRSRGIEWKDIVLDD